MKNNQRDMKLIIMKKMRNECKTLIGTHGRRLRGICSKLENVDLRNVSCENVEWILLAQHRSSGGQ
jgi:bisphosphoglycerate-dependent phosphoglycerate mutase